MEKQKINQGAMLAVGSILRGIYRIDSYLSSGGFGNTYVATNVEFEETCAIKEFFMKGVTHRDQNNTTVSVSNTDNKSLFEEQLLKFKKEARRMRKLKNPHIVAVHDLFEENGTAYYVMDYINGENLAEKLRRTKRPLSEKEVMTYLPQVLEALDTIHREGIWHLDLKPANIMIDRNGNVSLIDFGASKQQTNKGGATSTAVSYTNGFAPREQMEQNQEKFGPWTDIYALGATLYNLLANQRPPLPSDIDDDRSPDKHLALPLPESVSEKARTLILHLMTTNRLDRPQSVEEVQQLMEQIRQMPDEVKDPIVEEVDDDTFMARRPRRDGLRAVGPVEQKPEKPAEKPRKEKTAKEKPVEEKHSKVQAAKGKPEKEVTSKEEPVRVITSERKKSKWRVPLIAASAVAAVAIAAVFLLPGKKTEELPISQETVEQVQQEMKNAKPTEEVNTTTADAPKTTTTDAVKTTGTTTEKSTAAATTTPAKSATKETTKESPKKTSSTTTPAKTPTTTSPAKSGGHKPGDGGKPATPTTSTTNKSKPAKNNQGDYNSDMRKKYNLDDRQNNYNSGMKDKYGL